MSVLNKKSRLTSWLLNTCAIAFVVFPLISAGLWLNQLVNGDPRHTIELKSIPTSQPQLFKEPLLSITFDDGWQSIYQEAVPVMDAYGIASTQYVVPGTFKQHNYLSEAQTRSMQQAGHEIASHTWTHQNLTKITFSEAANQLQRAHKALLPFTDNKPMAFAAPEGDTNFQVMGAIKQLHTSHRNTDADLSNGVNEADVNIKPYFNRYAIIGYSIRPTTTLAQIQAAIDYARHHNGWVVLVYHQIDSSGAAWSTTPVQFKQHLELIKQSRIKTATLRDVLASHRGEK